MDRGSYQRSPKQSVRLPFRKSYPDVVVVQPGQDWDGYNNTGPLNGPTWGRILAQRQVCADLIVVRRVRKKNLPQVRLAKDQHPVQALATHGADQTLHIRILPLRGSISQRRPYIIAQPRNNSGGQHRRPGFSVAAAALII
jgi:hypothetical protein